jgi:adenosylhomocysteine nucleosidase
VRPERLAPGRGPTLARIRTGMGTAAASRTVSRLPTVAVEAALLGGFAGGLDPGLAPGTVVVADPLLDEEGCTVPAPLAGELETAARAAGLSVRRGPLVTVARVAATSEAKQALRERTGALAVDMESAALAAGLAARGVPSGAARVVLDAAGDALPAWGTGWLASMAQAAAWLRVGARIPGAARTSARLLESWLARARCSDPHSHAPPGPDEAGQG